MLKNFFQKYQLTSSDILIIACSGGPDSMYLLSEIIKILPNEHLIVAHFNHCLRGPESEGDEEFLRDFCKENHIIFTSTKKNITSIAQTTKKGIEETARIERYDFLEQTRIKYEARYILTAHHLDDSIETLMFHLIRGSKIHGLTGVPEQNGHILRPLLNVSKTEILKKLEKESVPYRLDSTNADDTYLRNHLRLNIINEFERINPEYRKNMISFMRYMTELVDFINKQVEVFLRGESSFSVEDFQILSPFLQREVIRYIYERANNGTIGLSERGIAEIIRFIGNKGNYTKKELGKLHLEKRNGRIYFDSHLS
ncbi:MAG: tRNA lysidine(34) synthetase TilS [Candidatus Gracilibacteria bacterium]|nr:tRNA lysidine(34) synthetase TilS [Candidatus Gracilibacteria bacterium]